MQLKFRVTEDYVAELVEELTRRIPRHLFPPSPKLLNLLHYLNDAQKFNKFAKRYFNYMNKPGEMVFEDSTKASTKKRKRCSSQSNTIDVDKSGALEAGSKCKRSREETSIPTPKAGRCCCSWTWPWLNGSCVDVQRTSPSRHTDRGQTRGQFTC